MADVGLTDRDARCKHTQARAQVSRGLSPWGLPQAPFTARAGTAASSPVGVQVFFPALQKQTLTCSPHPEAVSPPGGIGDGPAWPVHRAATPCTVLTAALSLARVARFFLSCRPFSSHSWETHFGHNWYLTLRLCNTEYNTEQTLYMRYPQGT